MKKMIDTMFGFWVVVLSMSMIISYVIYEVWLKKTIAH